MKEYKVWAFARSAAPNLPALEEQLADVMREADRRGYIIVNSCMEQKYGTEFWRPDLFAMLTAVQQGRVNAVIVQSLDRLSHDIATLYRILRFLQNYGAVLITTETNLHHDGVDTPLLHSSKHGEQGRTPKFGAVFLLHAGIHNDVAAPVGFAHDIGKL